MKSNFFLLGLLCAALLLPTTRNNRFEPVNAESANNNENIDLHEYVRDKLGRKIKNVLELSNLDGEKDFLCTEFEGNGYAIFYKNTLEMLEFSPNKSFEINKKASELYYNGPNFLFEKKGDCLTDISSKKKISANPLELREKADNIRQVFSKRSKKSFKIKGSKVISPAGEAKHPIDTDNPIKIDYGTKIPNYTYFTISPFHGDNKNGTCGAVAAEMLLTYHNYYSDRRIIPNNYLHGDSGSGKENNPNYCTDPIRMTPETLGARGTLEYDDSDPNNYFTKIVKIIPKNAMYSKVTSGIKSMLTERNAELDNKIEYSVEDKLGNWFGAQSVSTKRVIDQINNGNPSIVLLQSHLGAINHFVVAYGYEEHTYPGTQDTYSGFITNFGWGHDDINIWVNSLWINAYITMTVTHEHNYVKKGVIPGTAREEFRCSVCGHRTDAVILESNHNEKRCNEKCFHLPLNQELYTRFNDDDYTQKRGYEKFFYYKPCSNGNRLVQTFSNKSVHLDILDSDKKTILKSSESNGYSRNAFLNYYFEKNKTYYIHINLFPYRDEGDLKLVITPVRQIYSNYNSITTITSENTTTSLSLENDGVKVFLFKPTIAGVYTLTVDCSQDTVLYFCNPGTGTSKATFDDDSAGNLQPRIQTSNLNGLVPFFIICSKYSLFSNNAGSCNANLIIKRVA